MCNRLTDLMPPEIRNELELAGGEFSLKAGEAVSRDTLEGSYVYVVHGGVASKFMRSQSGLYSEIGMVGIEGMFPICGLLEVASAPHLVISQIGLLHGRRIRAREFHSIIKESPEAETLIRKYVYAFLTQIASNMMTSEQHVVERRTARWLLMCHDRVEGDELPITHEILAQMVSSHRPTVTNVLNDLKTRETIDLGRGRIIINDRSALAEMAGDAYGLYEDYWRREIGPYGRDFSDDSIGSAAA